MINESEVRIGNWVQTKRKGEFQIESIYEQGVNLDISGDYYGGWCCDYDGYFQNDWYGQGEGVLKPIPLTEEWLLKFGFEKTSNKNIFTKALFNFVLWGEGEFNEFYINETTVLRIKYVHELQNLYFALRREELTPEPISQV